jgi:hypothetical protein
MRHHLTSLVSFYVSFMQCAVCFEENTSMVKFLPCKHQEVCGACFLLMAQHARARPECPLCRTLVEHVEIVRKTANTDVVIASPQHETAD